MQPRTFPAEALGPPEPNRQRGLGADAARTLAFITLLCLAVVLQRPWLSRLFHFAPLQPGHIVTTVGAGLASIAWFELFKFLRKAPA